MNAVLLSSFETGHITDSTGYPWLQKFEGMFEQIVKAYEFIRDNDMMIVLPGVVENKAVQKNAWHVFPIYVNRNNNNHTDQEVLRQNRGGGGAGRGGGAGGGPGGGRAGGRGRPGAARGRRAD